MNPGISNVQGLMASQTVSLFIIFYLVNHKAEVEPVGAEADPTFALEGAKGVAVGRTVEKPCRRDRKMVL
jgi:hypothetical protein